MEVAHLDLSSFQLVIRDVNLRFFASIHLTVTNGHAEEKAADEAARAKEAAEQASLPYKWTQTIGDLDITVEIPGNLKAKDLNVDIKKTKIIVGIKGQEPILSVSLFLQSSSPI